MMDNATGIITEITTLKEAIEDLRIAIETREEEIDKKLNSIEEDTYEIQNYLKEDMSVIVKNLGTIICDEICDEVRKLLNKIDEIKGRL